MDDRALEQQRKLDRLEELLWVTEARAGSADAFGKLLHRYEKPILYYLRRLVPNPDAALDLHQEVWLDAFRGLRSLQIPEAFRAWLYRIAHHKAARHIQNEIRAEQLTDSLAEDSPPHTEDQPDTELLHKSLELLPPSQREILVLHYLRDLSTHEIGAVLDCPPGTVKSRLHHARIALRKILHRNQT